MFSVKPIRDKNLQKKLCGELNTAYYENALAYHAAEISEDGETVLQTIGICQFLTGEQAQMLTLVPSPGKEDDEAMIIMLRTAMHFLWRCGAKTMGMKKDAGPMELLSKAGLPLVNDVYEVDLEVFYNSPCHYNSEGGSV